MCLLNTDRWNIFKACMVWVCNLAQWEITEKYTFFQHDMVLKWESTIKLKCVGTSHCR
uniref:Uncharacterized protein n=1 Tax=Triticum urartu TaxID=4572 RepID=A0A8R7TET8_TRIUA